MHHFGIPYEQCRNLYNNATEKKFDHFSVCVRDALAEERTFYFVARICEYCAVFVHET